MSRELVPGEEGMVAALIRSGALIPVEVFGSCGHPVGVDMRLDTCEDSDHWSYGLSDRASSFSVAGSDCNRATGFILRPSDELMGTKAIRDALVYVTEEDDLGFPVHVP